MVAINMSSIDVIDLANAIIKLEMFLRSDMYKDIENENASKTYDKQTQLLNKNDNSKHFIDEMYPSL